MQEESPAQNPAVGIQVDGVGLAGHHDACTQAGPSFSVVYVIHTPTSPDTRGMQCPPASDKEEVRGKVTSLGAPQTGRHPQPGLQRGSGVS